MGANNATPFFTTPIAPLGRHAGLADAWGDIVRLMEIALGEIELGFRSYEKAGSVDPMGNVPVLLSVGRPLATMTRWVPSIFSLYDALGHDTSPSTRTFVVESHVPAASLIQGPTANAPPPFGLPLSHTNRVPAAITVVDTCAVPNGSAVGSIVDGDHEFTMPFEAPVVLGAALVSTVETGVETGVDETGVVPGIDC
jgi:hypothetical protein